MVGDGLVDQAAVFVPKAQDVGLDLLRLGRAVLEVLEAAFEVAPDRVHDLGFSLFGQNSTP